jgi:uncharacterized protein YkwD
MGKARRWTAILVATGALALVGAACHPSSGPAAPVGAQNCGPDATTNAIFAYTNNSRAANGLPPPGWNGQLGCLATSWSQSMASSNSFYHRDLNSVITSPGYAGYHTLGENILRGPASMSASDMHTAWVNSSDHRANILSPAYSSMGIGLAYANGQVLATENFGG